MGVWDKLFSKRGKAESEKPESSFSIPTVKFDSAWISKAIASDLHDFIRNLEDIPAPYREAVYRSALNAFRQGGALHILSKEIMDLRINGLAKSNVHDLVNHLWNRTTTLISIERAISVGLTKATWCYSGAPCSGSGRQDERHKSANKSTFTIADGVTMDGKRCWPGLERGCKCFMKVSVKGFDSSTT